MAFNSAFYFGVQSAPFTTPEYFSKERSNPFDEMMDLDVSVTNDPWAPVPIAPGVLDMDLGHQALDLEQPKAFYRLPLTLPTGLVTPPTPRSLPLCPPTPRPLSLTLADECGLDEPANAIADEEDVHRGRSPGPHGFVCPPAPRLDGAEFPGANPGPAPSLFGTRPAFGREFSALGLEFTAPSPTFETSPSTSYPTRLPFERRGNSDDLHNRISHWSTEVAAAGTHTTPVHSSSTRPWAEDFTLQPLTSTMQRSRASLSTDSSSQLDPWAARIGRSRGRTLDMPTAGRKGASYH